jgi:hypothetical protein
MGSKEKEIRLLGARGEERKWKRGEWTTAMATWSHE